MALKKVCFVWLLPQMKMEWRADSHADECVKCYIIPPFRPLRKMLLPMVLPVHHVMTDPLNNPFQMFIEIQKKTSQYWVVVKHDKYSKSDDFLDYEMALWLCTCKWRGPLQFSTDSTDSSEQFHPNGLHVMTWIYKVMFLSKESGPLLQQVLFVIAGFWCLVNQLRWCCVL